MLTDRQEKLLGFLIKEYITTAEPVSSLALKEMIDLDICGATIRNDLQVLTEEGYITQPHTSAGRIPTRKAYKYFADKADQQRERQLEDFIVRQARIAHEQMFREMKMMEELMQTLERDNLFDILNILEKWHKKTMN